MVVVVEIDCENIRHELKIKGTPVRENMWPTCVQMCETETGHLSEKGISQSKTATGHSDFLCLHYFN